jgi:FG-GAP-like repeat
VIADHGTDISPFPGGISRMLFATKKGQLRDVTASHFPMGERFTFHVSPGDIDQDGDLDLFVTTLQPTLPSTTRTNEDPEFWINDGKGRFSSNPKLWEREPGAPVCQMTSALADLDGDGVLELIVGACDTAEASKQSTFDRIYSRSRDGVFRIARSSILRPRQLGPDWGTVAMKVADLNRDGLPEIISVTHNPGFTRSAIQVQVNLGKLQFRELLYPLPYQHPNGKDAFIPWIDANDFDGDGKTDLVFTLRPAKSGVELEKAIWLFKNEGRESFVDITPKLSSNYFASAWFIDLNHDQRYEVVALSGDGRVTILKSPATERVSK